MCGFWRVKLYVAAEGGLVKGEREREAAGEISFPQDISTSIYSRSHRTCTVCVFGYAAAFENH